MNREIRPGWVRDRFDYWRYRARVGLRPSNASYGGDMSTNVDELTRTQVVPAPGTGPDETYFRFPAADDPNPGTRRLLGMSVYASLLGLAGVGVGARGLVSTIGGGVPGWYVPLLAFAGMLSVALSVGAFLSIHRRALPWMLLLGAAVPLAAAVALAVAY